ncbi:MAG: HNH endonuclease family protein [Pseudomonadota bacterium]
MQLSRDLKSNSEFYSAVYDSSSAVWSQYDSQERTKITKYIEELQLFGVNQYNPLLLSVLDDKPQLMLNVARLVWAIAFRFNIIQSGSTGNVERAVADAAMFVRSNPNCNAREIFQKLESLYPSDEIFEESFKIKSISKSAVARYILKEINDKLMEGSAQEVRSDTNQISLEHVLPKKFDPKDWSEFSEEEEVDVADYVNRLGNMTLLTSGVNRRAANNSFAEKLTTYLEEGTDALLISEYIFGQSDWKSSNVEQNQAKLARVAKRVWRVDYQR